jgi:hypothetical protein
MVSPLLVVNVRYNADFQHKGEVVATTKPLIERRSPRGQTCPEIYRHIFLYRELTPPNASGDAIRGMPLGWGGGSGLQVADIDRTTAAAMSSAEGCHPCGRVGASVGVPEN